MKINFTGKQVLYIASGISMFCALLGVIFISLLYTNVIRINYPSKMQFPVRGIDISHHQGVISWEQLSNNDIHFVFMKATEGGDHKDRQFNDNWVKAEQNGFLRGAYHFFTFCRTGKEQAANFIETVPVESGVLPPVIDFEFGGNCKARPSRETIIKELNDFISEIERVYHKTPILYVTNDSFDEFIDGGFINIQVWIRDIYWSPSLPDNREWTFWQFNNRGKIEGIPNPVDLNVFNGSKEDFLEIIQ